MDSLLGLLRVRIIRGVNLAFRDACGSDPYIVLRLGHQGQESRGNRLGNEMEGVSMINEGSLAKLKLKTSVKKKNVNPEWNEDLTLSISNPLEPIKLQVYGKDTFSHDDKMGDAEFEIQSFVEL